MKKKRIKKIKTKRVIFTVLSFLLFVFGISTYFKTYSEFVTSVQRQKSGVVDNIVYVNDAEADYYTYMAENYTYSANDTIPTTVSKNIYTRDDFAELTITYSGKDLVTNEIGYVSTSEEQDTFIYYKVLPINDNGTASNKNDDYVTLELIDNPFAKRPNNYGFNGWITNYQGSTIYLDKVYYVRYAKIPVSYESNKPKPIEITFNAKWIDAKTVKLSDNNSRWSTAFNELDDEGFVLLGSRDAIYEDMSGYYIVHYYNTGYNGRYPNGALDDNLNDMSGQPCRYYCQYYTVADSEYDPDAQYYEYSPYYGMQWHNAQIIGYNEDPGVPANSNIAGYYKLVHFDNNEDYSNVYSSNGTYIESGTCSGWNGCDYYELQGYYDSNGNPNITDGTRSLYYLVTRDTNVIIFDRNMSSVWGSSQNKPFTLTGINGNTVTTNYLSINSNGVYINTYNDTRIEYIEIYTNQSRNTNSPSSSTRRMIYANFKNLKIGRGIRQDGTYVNALAVIGGNTSTSSQGSSTNPLRYRVIVESGRYNNISVSQAALGSGSSKPTIYTNGQLIAGNDYDRVKENNDNLEVYENMNGTFGGKYVEDSDHDPLFSITLKSGQVGTSRNAYSTGIYVGGHGYSTDSISGTMKLKVEGGWAYNLIGGPLVNSTYQNRNVVDITMTGGSVESIYGGAGDAATYGNRIIKVLGGVVNYSIFGGSNGYQSDEGKGTLNGSTYIYVGGNATIGLEANVNDANAKMFGAEAGSVFGIGNGKTGSSTIGSCDNSNIIINDNAKILKNVYGGGNYGATGVNSTSSTTTTTIKMLNGTVSGSIYGGGNNNGSGSSSKASTINLTVENGTVKGNVYGGSKTLGRVYGDTNVTVNGGKVTNVYGGGEGGYSSSTNYGTFVSGNVNVTIGSNESTLTPEITKVYGGSAFGTVNGTNNTTTVQNKTTKVTVNKGTITQVFGGGEGNDTYTPYVEGNVTVTINNGTITDVYGGNDAKGTPNGTIDVYVNNGTITNTFGGGNLAPIKTSTVYLNGGTSTNVYGGGNLADATTTNVKLQGSTTTSIYGGSNQSGTVNESNITVTSGTATTIYGGNNLGGSTTTTDIDVNGGTVATVFGGGNEADTGTTDVTINSGNVTTVFGGGNKAETTTTNVLLNGSTITDVYGGGNKAGVNDSTNVTLAGSTVTNLYGGSNESGTVNESNITVTSGTATTIYGGNNLGGSTTTTDIDVNGGTVATVFGGGNEADTGTTDVTINSGNVTTVFGGGNKADVTDTNVNIYATTNTISNVYGGGNEASAETTNVTINNGAKITNVFGGSNQTGTVDESNISIPFSGTAPVISNIYGGNNQGGQTLSANIDTKCGQIGNIYGGGNYATTTSTNTKIQGTTVTGNVYGGGNQASVLENSTLKIINSRITDNVFGGGNLGTIGKNTDVFVSNSILNNSLFAGGNGFTAVVYGNTLLNIEGTTNVANHVFGGGNAAATGTVEENNSSSVVNIAGLNCGGNVYGGANTSVLYGTVNVNIGSNAITGTTLNKGDIHIGGTVFGGGEANASGSEIYDFSFISVTTGITINIDGYTYNNFDIDGSIFGSGNASSTSGYSNVNIRNYGTVDNYKENVSIQRASVVTLDNSSILLTGATDRTNEYSDVLFSLSRLDELKLLNNSTLYLENSTNLVKKFTSAKTTVNGEEKAAVQIDEDGVQSKNVDNKLYIYAGRNINIATNENITAYGEVSGMTFFGMFLYDRNGKAETALYKTEYNNDTVVDSSELVFFTTGSYVLGKHNTNHNIEVDGFYSNFPSKTATDKLTVQYIVPTPEDAGYYMWSIGEQVASYEISLTASKYSTLGTYELPLINFSAANTTFSVLGFNFNELNPEVNLVEKNDIPRIADSGSDADNTMGLVMKSSETGWITKGSTTFLTSGDNHYPGVTSYLSENSNVVPTFLFYLYHSKNLETSGNMGSVTISMVAITPIDDLNNEVKRVNIIVNLSRALFTTDDYEGTITTGKVYEMFAPGVVNITTTSSFTTYYSLFVEKDETIYRNGYHRVLASTYNFPANTKITMIDLLSGTNPEYYYYVVSENDYRTKGQELAINGDVAYSLDKFIRMGSSNNNNHYDDATMNLQYYDAEHGLAEEEFIFIVDFKEAGINEDVLNKSLLLELRDNDNQIIYSVIGVQQQQLFYNLYANKESVIDLTGRMGTNEVYIGEKVPLLVETNFVQQTVNSNNVIDTNYYDYRTGIKISILDSNGNVVNGPSIMGISYTLGLETYYPRFDGTVRINVAERIANVSSNIIINTEGSNLASGDYTLLIESFGSPDGIYYGLVSSDQEEIPFTVKNTLYGLKVVASERQLIVKKKTGITEDGANAISFNFQYSSGLLNPNLRVSLYRRDYEDIYSDIYHLVDFKDFFSNDFAETNRNKTYMLFENPESTMSTVLYLKENLTSGTYKVVFGLYDNNTYIGDVYKYIIIK